MTSSPTFLIPTDVEIPGDTLKPSSKGKIMDPCPCNNTRTPAWSVSGPMYCSCSTLMRSRRPSK